MNCLEQYDLNDLAESFLTAFDQRVAEIPADLCAPFFQEARRLEADLLGHYRLVARLASKVPPDDLASVSELWGSMVQACDVAATRLRNLSAKHPECGAGMFYDSVLDLRNKCSRLQMLHS